MPKAITQASTIITSTPYAHPTLTSTSNSHVSHTNTDYSISSSAGQDNEDERLVYSKTALLALVLSTSKLDWAAIGKGGGKTKAQTYDIWRKSMHPALIDIRPWSSGTGAMGKEIRTKIMIAVLKSVKPDFVKLAESFAGKSKSQLFDAWRKSIVPRLTKGETVE